MILMPPAIPFRLAQTLDQLTQTKVIGLVATQSEAGWWLTAHQNPWDLAVVDLGLAEATGIDVISYVDKTALSQ